MRAKKGGFVAVGVFRTTIKCSFTLIEAWSRKVFMIMTDLSEKATTMIVVLLVSESSLILFPSFFGYEMPLKSPLVLYWVKC